MPHVVFNAIPSQLGGGLSLTQLFCRPLLDYLPDVDLTILASRTPVVDELRSIFPNVNVRQVVPDAASSKTFLWQNVRLGRELKNLDADTLISMNHFVDRVPCSQIVYHVNLLRFLRQPRTSFKSKLIEGLRDRAAVRALKYADANVFETEYLFKTAMLTTSSSVTVHNPSVVYNALPDDVFATSRPVAPSDEGPKTLLAVTNTNTYKDNGTLVRTLATLVERHPGHDWRLEIASGVDPLQWTDVREQANELGVIDRITWLGFLDRAGLEAATRRALCVVSTSLIESFMLVGCEAMARGCPTVVADCAAMPESVGDAGLLAAPGDAGSFARQIIRLTDPAFRATKVDEGLAFTQRYRRETCGREWANIVGEIAHTDHNHEAVEQTSQENRLRNAA